ncbi:hypothetical protein NX722_05665 [Endozoicomonas gorgoniicola]|uniref:Uncharacterized protein n=1 Tax=Endozoicomonas gorgoniicola TaxID=1234144 RepID=A0ABT3MRZ3_9GAMM|nr:hypothetical protein [Endozoicomonas gorgoniicola]MCW7552140.1 hypothetical protein [Endozoicomonas gorgoniicola]
MKVRLRVPVIYEDQLYQQGKVLEVSPLEGGRMVHDKIAVPEPDAPRRKVIRPAETRRYG